MLLLGGAQGKEGRRMSSSERQTDADSRMGGARGNGKEAERQNRVRDTLRTFRKLRRVPSPLPPTSKLSLHKSEGEEKDHSQGA